MSVFDNVKHAIEEFGKLRLKARFVFRSINPLQGGLIPGVAVFGGAGFFVFPMNPQSFDIQRPTQGAVYRTEGGRYEEDWGMGIERFALRGTFGFSAKMQLGSGGLPLLGMDQLLLFQDFITGYYNTSRQDKMLGEATWEFYDLADMYFLKVRIDMFRMRRIVNEPYLHFYDLQCTVLEDYFSAGSIIPRLPDPFPNTSGPGLAMIVPAVLSALGAVL